MDLNQITTNFNIITTVVHKLSARCRMFKISDDNSKEFSLDIKCSKPTIDENEMFGKLLMQITVSVLQENTELPADQFDLIIEGVFASPADISEDEFLQMLNINGGAALYSIARAKLEAFSSLIYAEGKILLPMVNIVQYFNQRNAHNEE